MSTHVKTFEWPLPKGSKKLQSAPQTGEMQPGAQGMSGFPPQSDSSSFGASLEETTGMWKGFLQQVTSGEATSDPPRCWQYPFHLRSSVSCPVWGSRWSYTHSKTLGRVNCHPFLHWRVALGLLGPCPFQKHSACGRKQHRHLSLEAGQEGGGARVLVKPGACLTTVSPRPYAHRMTDWFWEPHRSPLWFTATSQFPEFINFSLIS